MVDSFQTSATPRANGTALHTSIVKIVSDRQGMVENPPDKVSMFRRDFLFPEVVPSRVGIASRASYLRVSFPLYCSMIARFYRVGPICCVRPQELILGGRV
jgi:hypothetical protein